MRWVVLVLAVLVGTARADDLDDQVAQGEALAKQGEFTKAIDLFKQVDAKRPRAAYACLIGLVYTRRELWPQAELFFARCRARATADDPLPSWIDKAQQQLVDKLSATGAAAVTITVRPPTAPAHITVSSFAPDETFEPGTIHLAPGHHVLDITADGFVSSSREVVVKTSDPQTISIELHTVAEVNGIAAAKAAAARAALQPAAPAPAPPPRSMVPMAVMLGGAALGVAGGAFQWLVYKPAHDRLASAPDGMIYDSRISSFSDRRDITIGLYAGAAIAVAAGIVLRYTIYDRVPVTLSGTLSGSVEHGGGVVSLAWSR